MFYKLCAIHRGKDIFAASSTMNGTHNSKYMKLIQRVNTYTLDLTFKIHKYIHIVHIKRQLLTQIRNSLLPEDTNFRNLQDQNAWMI